MKSIQAMTSLSAMEPVSSGTECRDPTEYLRDGTADSGRRRGGGGGARSGVRIARGQPLRSRSQQRPRRRDRDRRIRRSPVLGRPSEDATWSEGGPLSVSRTECPDPKLSSRPVAGSKTGYTRSTDRRDCQRPAGRELRCQGNK